MQPKSRANPLGKRRPLPMKPIFVIGHKNPDTDSICSAICYANLKQKITGDPYIACRAGAVNNETKYVLDCFGVEEPQLVQSLEPRVADVQYRKVEGINRRVSLKRAWEHMRDNQIQTIPVLTKWGQLKGIVTLGDVARFYMEDQGADALADARTSYRNIVETLKGEMIVGDPGLLHPGQGGGGRRQPGRDGGLHRRTRHGDLGQPLRRPAQRH